mgnify:CR=1 FL=1
MVRGASPLASPATRPRGRETTDKVPPGRVACAERGGPPTGHLGEGLGHALRAPATSLNVDTTIDGVTY